MLGVLAMLVFILCIIGFSGHYKVANHWKTYFLPDGEYGMEPIQGIVSPVPSD